MQSRCVAGQICTSFVIEQKFERMIIYYHIMIMKPVNESCSDLYAKKYA